MHVICFFSRNKKGIIIKDNILYREYYNDHSEVSLFKVLLPEKLLRVLVQSLHGTTGNYPGIPKMIKKKTTKVLLSFNCNILQKLGSRVSNMHSRKTHKKTRTISEFIHIPERDLVPEVFMQIDLLPELQPS